MRCMKTDTLQQVSEGIEISPKKMRSSRGLHSAEIVSVASPIRESKVNSARLRKTTRIRLESLKEKPAELEELNHIDLTSTDWKKRYENVERLSSLLMQHGSSLAHSSQLLPAVDSLCRAVTDQNLKVSLHALRAFTKVAPQMAKGLEVHLNLIVNALAVVLGASHSGIVAEAERALSTLKGNTDSCLLFQHVSQVLEGALPKSKGYLLGLLTQLLPSVRRRPALIAKQAIPLAYRLLEDSKGEMRRISEEYVRTLHEITDLFANVPPEKRTRLEVLVNEAL